MRTHIQGILTQDISKEMEYILQQPGVIAVNVRPHDTGRPWMECLSPRMRQSIITSTCTPSLPTKRDMCLCVKLQIRSLASNPAQKFCTNPFIYAFIRIGCIYTHAYAYMQRERERERERAYSSSQKKQRMRGEILSLVARGKRSLHVCARPRLPLALLVILCCEFPCVKLLQQKNLLSPRPAYAAAACSHTTSARHAVVSREGETWREVTVGRKVSEKCPK